MPTAGCRIPPRFRPSVWCNDIVEDRLQSLADALASTDRKLRSGTPAGGTVWPTGFRVLDEHLGGGIRSGELALLGGPHGLGKTTFMLQMLRNVVAAGGHAVYFCFEHDAHTILHRLLALELSASEGAPALPMNRLRELFQARHSAAGPLAERLADLEGGPQALSRLSDYAARLQLHASSGSHTTVATIAETVQQLRERIGRPPVVVIDYLQKVRVEDGPLTEDDRVTLVVEGLKDLALDADVPVVAVVAADKDGLVPGKRMRVQNLRGSSALAYEPDIVLVMNEKFDVVARHHLVYDLGSADRFRDWVVLTVEKNRNGRDNVDLEFRKRFEEARFEPDGNLVAERLTDERVFVE